VASNLASNRGLINRLDATTFSSNFCPDISAGFSLAEDAEDEGGRRRLMNAFAAGMVGREYDSSSSEGTSDDRREMRPTRTLKEVINCLSLRRISDDSAGNQVGGLTDGSSLIKFMSNDVTMLSE
jgi:hypothetical protein